MPRSLENVEDIYPLTPIQEGMLFHAISGADASIFINQIVFDASSTERERLETAWETLQHRHPALRTVFAWDVGDSPLQVVRRRVKSSFLTVRLNTSGDSDVQEVFSTWLKADRQKGFDLKREPASRMTWVELPACAPRVVWTTHHLVSDGWSTEILLEELNRIYIDGSDVDLAPAPAFRNLVARQIQKNAPEDERFWREMLVRFREPHRLEFPGLRPTKHSVGHDMVSAAIEPDLAQSVVQAAQKVGVTQSTVFAGVWSILLSKWQHSDDVVFGMTLSTRPSEIEHCDRLVGPLINTLPFRAQSEPHETVEGLLRKLQAQFAAINERSHCSLADIQRWSEVARGDSLFESIFVFENVPSQGGDVEKPLTPTSVAIEYSNYPLALLVHPGAAARVEFVFDRSRFHGACIRRLVEAYVSLLTEVSLAPERPIAELRKSFATVSAALVGSKLQCDADILTRNVFEQVVSRSRLSPSAVAVSCGKQSFSYKDLIDRSTQFAKRFAAEGVCDGDVVGVAFDREPDAIAAMLGVLGSNAAYAPLDPSYPQAHTERVLGEAGIEVVAASSALAMKFGRRRHVTPGDKGAEAPLPSLRGGGSAAYVIHTSGSSGVPKGVLISHGALLRSTTARYQFYGAPPKRFLMVSPLAFDSSVAGVYWTLLGGGELILPRDGEETDVERLAEIIEHKKVSHLLCLPSVYEMLLESKSAAQRLKALRVAIVAGEPCSAGIPRLHRDIVPDAALYNEYGPTETTVWCAAARIDQEVGDCAPPIGKPIPGVSLYLLDQHGAPVVDGAIGELCVAGETLAIGYLNDDRKTHLSFPTLGIGGEEVRVYRTGDLAYLSDESDLYFVGRRDNQVKIRGRRVEVEHVASVLAEFPEVKEAVAALKTSPGSLTPRLIAYAVAKNDVFDKAAALAHLKTQLPSFMIPDDVVQLSAIPRLPNGKIDAAALPTPELRREGSRAPKTPSESAVAEIFSALLGVQEIGIDEDFFEIGGDSLLAMRLVGRIRKKLGKTLSVSSLIEAPTIAGIAQLVEAGDQSRPWRALVPLRANGNAGAIVCVCAPFSPALFYKPIADRLEDQRPVVAFEPVGQENEAPPLSSIEEMAELYVAELLEAYPRGPFALIGFCIGATVCHEMARRLRDAGHEVEILVAVGAALPFQDTALASLFRKAKTALFAGGIGTLYQRTAKFIGVRAARHALASAGHGSDQPQAWGEAAAAAFRRAFENYNIKKAETPILSIMASGSVAVIGKKAHLSWRALTDDFEAAIVKGEQDTVMSPPEVDGVARIVNEALARRSKQAIETARTVVAEYT